MDKNMVAVAAGYYFGLVPVEECKDINLSQVGAVRFQGENWPLYKGSSYDDSRKIDKLLDRCGEYSVKDHRIEPVIMSGEVEMTVPGVHKDRDSLLFGGYSFVCDGKKIPFDFSGTAWDIQQEGDTLSIPFCTGRTALLTDHYLDGCYEDEYANLGLRINDITAEFLSQAESIHEFMVSLEMDGKEYEPEGIAEIGRFAIKSLQFENDTEQFAIKQEVLDDFNHRMNQEKSLSDQIRSASRRAGGTGVEETEPAKTPVELER